MIEKIDENEFISGKQFNEVTEALNSALEKIDVLEKKIGIATENGVPKELIGLSAEEIRKKFTIKENKAFADALGIEYEPKIKEPQLSELIFEKIS